MICKNCNNEYSKKEVIRVFGDVWWSSSFCSARCFTLHNAAQQNAHQTPETQAQVAQTVMFHVSKDTEIVFYDTMRKRRVKHDRKT